jgi:hypothetical protein
MNENGKLLSYGRFVFEGAEFQWRRYAANRLVVTHGDGMIITDGDLRTKVAAYYWTAIGVLEVGVQEV